MEVTTTGGDLAMAAGEHKLASAGLSHSGGRRRHSQPASQPARKPREDAGHRDGPDRPLGRRIGAVAGRVCVVTGDEKKPGQVRWARGVFFLRCAGCHFSSVSPLPASGFQQRGNGAGVTTPPSGGIDSGAKTAKCCAQHPGARCNPEDLFTPGTEQVSSAATAKHKNGPRLFRIATYCRQFLAALPCAAGRTHSAMRPSMPELRLVCPIIRAPSRRNPRAHSPMPP